MFTYQDENDLPKNGKLEKTKVLISLTITKLLKSMKGACLLIVIFKAIIKAGMSYNIFGDTSFYPEPTSTKYTT